MLYIGGAEVGVLVRFYRIFQERFYKGLKGISSGRGKKWSYFGGILKVESLGLADRLEVACERK